MTSRRIVDDVREGAHHAFEKTEATATSAKLGVIDAIGRASEVYRTLRALGLDDMLRTVGLQRRSSPALSLGMFGMGVAAGAVLGVMLAPMSGREARQAILQRATDLLQRSETGAEQAVQTAKEVVQEAGAEVKSAGAWKKEQQDNGRMRS